MTVLDHQPNHCPGRPHFPLLGKEGTGLVSGWEATAALRPPCPVPHPKYGSGTPYEDTLINVASQGSGASLGVVAGAGGQGTHCVGLMAVLFITLYF
jgi:hypothetical protein